MEDDESDGDRLLDAARRLAGAFSALLTAAQPENQEVSVAVLQSAPRSLLPSSTRTPVHHVSPVSVFLFASQTQSGAFVSSMTLLFHLLIDSYSAYIL